MALPIDTPMRPCSVIWTMMNAIASTNETIQITSDRMNCGCCTKPYTSSLPMKTSSSLGSTKIA